MAGKVEYLNPEGLVKSPVFTQVVAVSGAVRTIYVGGQNGVDASARSCPRSQARSSWSRSMRSQ